MPHKYQVMTNLIFTTPPPYADEGIIAVVTLQKGYGDAMTLTSKAYIDFWDTQQPIYSAWNVTFYVQSIALAGICDGSVFCRTSHQAPRKMSELMTTCKRLLLR